MVLPYQKEVTPFTSHASIIDNRYLTLWFPISNAAWLVFSAWSGSGWLSVEEPQVKTWKSDWIFPWRVVEIKINIKVSKQEGVGGGMQYQYQLNA